MYGTWRRNIPVNITVHIGNLALPLSLGSTLIKTADYNPGLVPCLGITQTVPNLHFIVCLQSFVAAILDDLNRYNLNSFYFYAMIIIHL